MDNKLTSILNLTVYLGAEDVRKSIKFYRDKLGFELRQYYPSEKKPTWANLVLGDQSLMLGTIPSPAQMKKLGATMAQVERGKRDAKAFAKHPRGVGVSVYLLVPDVDVYYETCRKNRVPVLTPLETHFYGLRDFAVEDPDGYRLVFYSHRSSALHAAVDEPKAECDLATA